MTCKETEMFAGTPIYLSTNSDSSNGSETVLWILEVIQHRFQPFKRNQTQLHSLGLLPGEIKRTPETKLYQTPSRNRIMSRINDHSFISGWQEWEGMGQFDWRTWCAQFQKSTKFMYMSLVTQDTINVSFNTDEISQWHTDEQGITIMSYDMNVLCGEKKLEHWFQFFLLKFALLD